MSEQSFFASATASVFGFTNTGDKVTATASANASAATSYEDALSIAKVIAFNVAKSELETNIDIIQQTISIVESENLGPTGPTGPTGAQGAQGATGIQGATGPTINQQKQSLFGYSNTLTELNNFQLTRPETSTSPYYYNIQSNVSQGSYSNLTSGSGGVSNQYQNANVTQIIFTTSERYFGKNFCLCGSFTDVSSNYGDVSSNYGDIKANYIATYNTNYGYSPSPFGLNSEVGSIVYDPLKSSFFSGTTIYAGGIFSDISGVDFSFFDGSLNRIAKWDGNNWSPLGGGLSNPDYLGSVSVIKFDPTDPSNNNLYVGGSFTDASGILVNRIAKWDGIMQTWSALGDGVSNTLVSIPNVGSLAFDSNNNLYAGGYFENAGDVLVNNIAKWDGSSWSALGSGVTGVTNSFLGTHPSVNCFAFDSRNNLYVGGYFNNAGGVSVNNIAKWDGNNWSALGSGITNAINFSTSVNSLVFDSSNNLYVGGYFNNAGGVEVNNIAKWDGNSWSALGSGLTSSSNNSYTGVVNTLLIDDDFLYIGGNFDNAGGVAVSNIAKVELNFNNYIKNTDGNDLYLNYSGKGSVTNLLHYDETSKVYSQVN